MNAMTLRQAWQGTPPSSPVRPPPPPGQPADLYMRALDEGGQVILVSFSLGRLLALTRAELDVVRWADAGHPNGVIARERQTSMFTVARQMGEALPKLGISARLLLATIPELRAWSPQPLGIGAAGGMPAATLPSESGREVEPREATRIWREIAAGQWSTVAGVDAGGLRHAVMRRDTAKPVAWAELDEVHRAALALMAGGFAQKVIAMKLGLAASTVSGALKTAHKRLGFRSLGQLLRAYCASMDIIDLESDTGWDVDAGFVEVLGPARSANGNGTQARGAFALGR
jgi:DNA-binding NarL/FixJ family response regulator